MKRLFRTSKPIIDPLPPPPPPVDYSSQPQPQQPNGASAPVKKSGSALKLEALGHGHASEAPSGGGGGKNWFGVSSAPSVTPFPPDAGHGGGAGGHMRRLSRREKKEKPSAAPSMLEIQQMQQQRSAKHESLPYPPPPPQPVHPSRFYEESHRPDAASPDSAWTVLPPNPSHAQHRYTHTPSPELLDSRSQTPPLPIPSAPGLQGSGGSGRSSPSGHLYLPPGARPPTPPAALRPATPNYSRSPMAHSQSSLHSHGDEVVGVPRHGRDRGYSSASGSMRGSDVESSTGHMAAPGPKPAKIQPTQPVRSPLAHAYASPPNLPSFPTPQPHPFQLPPGQPRPNAYSPMEEDFRQLSMQPPPPSQQQQAVYEEQPQNGKDKEKKKFWGMDMGWTGGKKDKDEKKGRDKDGGHLGVREGEGGGRRSFDWSRAQDHSVGQTGYSVTQPPSAPANMGSAMVMEDEQRGRMAGRMFFRDQDNKDPSSAKDVSIAIQMLCANPDPSFSAVYSVCDRMNNSDHPESICKDAARAIRKQFKHGNEGERRAVAVVWLLMMRNVPAVRVHAASKKVLASLEPILLAPPSKPIVNPITHRTITDILADLAYNFGGEKGCEPLVEMWKKVKMPQEPDNGVPLAEDHQIFTPEAQFPTHILDRQGNMNNPQSGAPYMANGHGGYYPHEQGEDRPPGPGYANLPSHTEDMRRLLEESTTGKEAARVLSEAVTFCRPEELNERPIVREFYNKCFHAHESLTNQMDWAQAEARSSRERTMSNGLSLEPQSEYPRPADTIEEQALAALFEAHAALSEAIRQHDELDRIAMEQREMSEVRERSKNDMKMGRDDPSRYEQQAPIKGFLSVGQTAQASSSRSPSPAADRLGASPRQHHLPLPPQFSATSNERSRTPSPDHFAPPPRISSSPHRRPPSPLGARAPRPLPNPFKSTNSSSSLKSSSVGHPGWTAPANLDPARNTSSQGHGASKDDDEDLPSVPLKPSRKALGKRPAQAIDPDNHFDPNDMFAGQKEPSSKASSEESVTPDDVFFHQPVKYVYDAYQEKIDRELLEARSGGCGGGSGSSAMRSIPAREGGGSGAAMYSDQRAARVDTRA